MSMGVVLGVARFDICAAAVNPMDTSVHVTFCVWDLSLEAMVLVRVIVELSSELWSCWY
jgi:hypothetical protein